MCTVIGGNFPALKEQEISLIKDLFLQSKIRGKHATGISYVDNGAVVTIKQPIPASDFIHNLQLERFLGKNFSFVGHCRYSTSDLEYNQPISNDKLSIVHNGVITQEPFEKWESLFNFVDFKTKNDSELIFKCHEKNEHPLINFPLGSMAVCGLTPEQLGNHSCFDARCPLATRGN